VIQKDLKQWYFKITQYQDELIKGLANVDWPAPTKSHQTLIGIGRSERSRGGILPTKALQQKLNEFLTTRLDTIFFGNDFHGDFPQKKIRGKKKY
jgi:leucyl-tRNA synthetase